MLWKIRKLYWSALEWLITLFLATIQFPQVQLTNTQKILRFFQEMLQKNQFQEEKQVFSFKTVYQYAQESVIFLAKWVSYWWNKDAHLSEGIVWVFEEMAQDFLKKKHKKFEFDKRSFMFWGAIRSDGQKLLVKCPHKLNAVSYLEILNIYEKMHFLDIIFQQDNAPVHKSKIIGIFS